MGCGSPVIAMFFRHCEALFPSLRGLKGRGNPWLSDEIGCLYPIRYNSIYTTDIFVQHGLEVVVLLAGGDKSSQANDIAAAIGLARQLKE